jgi:hypothetical protein
MVIAGVGSDAQDMPLSPGAFPPLLPDQFTLITGALVVLAVGLALLVVTATLAVLATSDTENQTRDFAHEQIKS